MNRQAQGRPLVKPEDIADQDGDDGDPGPDKSETSEDDEVPLNMLLAARRGGDTPERDEIEEPEPLMRSDVRLKQFVIIRADADDKWEDWHLPHYIGQVLDIDNSRQQEVRVGWYVYSRYPRKEAHKVSWRNKFVKMIRAGPGFDKVLTRNDCPPWPPLPPPPPLPSPPHLSHSLSQQNHRYRIAIPTPSSH